MVTNSIVLRYSYGYKVEIPRSQNKPQPKYNYDFQIEVPKPKPQSQLLKDLVTHVDKVMIQREGDFLHIFNNFFKNIIIFF